MANNEKQNPLSRAASTVVRAFTRAKEKLTHHDDVETVTPVAMETAPRSPEKGRGKRATSDIPMADLNNSYTPDHTSLKTGFRTDGGDQHRDQEFAGGFSDERFNDEDRITNKSGDPRIGTHGRTYEPGETKGEQR
jgi:hypothetical protein